MNLKIIEKSLIPLFLATIFIVAFNWQFTHVYAFLIEHFREEKLSLLYAHLFIYTFLIFTLFLFLMNLINHLLKSNVFIAMISIALLLFYLLSHTPILDSIHYFINYPLSVNQLMFMILFMVSTFIYGVYSLAIVFFNKHVPFSHSLVFLLIALFYSAWFIELYDYPISTIMTRF